MTSVLYCTIKRGTGATTDYGPAGNNSLAGLSVEVSGPNAVGTATITLYDRSAGYDIRTRDFVKIYMSSDAGVTIDDRIFVGFVEDRSRTPILGAASPFVVWEIKVQDCNILEDWLRQQAITGQGIVDGGVTTIDDQLQRITRAVTTNNVAGSCPFDDVSGMALTAPLTTDITFNYQQLSLRDMLDKRLKAYQSSYPSQRPRQFMGFTTTGGASSFGPQLNVYDEAALLSGAAKYTFSTNPSGANKRIRALKETRQGGNLVTSVQAFAFTNGGLIRQRSTSANTATYPNLYDQRPIGGGGSPLQAWDGPAIKMPDGSTSAQVSAAAAQEISASENPAETFEIVSLDSFASGLLPGDTIAIDATAELGLTGYKRVVASVSAEYQVKGDGTYQIERTVVAGNQLLELGDGQKRQTAPVQEGDTVHPEPPTSVTANVLIGEGEMDVFLSWALSVSQDVVSQRVHYRINSGGEYIVPIGGTDTQFTVVIPYSLTYQIWLTAVDGAGNESEPSNVISSTAPEPPPLPNLLNPDFNIVDPRDTTQAWGWTFTPTNSGVGTRELASAVGASVQGKYVYQISCPGGGFNGGTITSHKISIADTTAAGVSANYARYVRAILQSSAALGAYNVTCDVYDNLDNLVGSVTVASGTPNGSYQYADGNFVQAGAAYFTIAIDVINDGVSALTVWISGVATGDAVITNMIKNLNVTSGKIAALAVTSSKLAAGAVTAGKIGTGGISAAAQFAAGVVDSAALGAGAVTAGKIAAGGISASTQFAAGVVNNTALATITDTSKFHFDATTGPLTFYDDLGTARGSIVVDRSLNFFRMQADPTAVTELRLNTSHLSIIQHDDATSSNRYIQYASGTADAKHQFTGGSVAIHDAVLATGATNAFLYIPYMNGTPSGLPGAITGGAPMVWDDTNKKLYVYSVGAAAWKSVTLT